MALMDQAEALAKRNAFQPVTQDFDESKGVAGRVQSLQTPSGPMGKIMKTAVTRATQAANARGVKNSSLGVQAGEQAVLETAIPIATSDANLYQQQSLTNQAAKNTAGQFNSGQATTAGMTGMQMDQSESQFGRNLGETARQFDTNNALARDQFGETRRQFDTNTGLARDQLGENRRQFDTTSTLSRDQFNSDAAFRQAQLAEQSRQFGSGQDLTRELANKDDAFRNQQLAQQQGQFDAQQRQEVLLRNMDEASKVKLLEIESAFKTDIQRDLNISNAWGTTQDAISKVQNNPDLDAATKTTLIQNTLDSFKSYTNFWKKADGAMTRDVSDLLNFGVTSGGNNPVNQPGGGATPAPGPATSPANQNYFWEYYNPS